MGGPQAISDTICSRSSSQCLNPRAVCAACERARRQLQLQLCTVSGRHNHLQGSQYLLRGQRSNHQWSQANANQRITWKQLRLAPAGNEYSRWSLEFKVGVWVMSCDDTVACSTHRGSVAPDVPVAACLTDSAAGTCHLPSLSGGEPMASAVLASAARCTREARARRSPQRHWPAPVYMQDDLLSQTMSSHGQWGRPIICFAVTRTIQVMAMAGRQLMCVICIEIVFAADL